MDENSPIYESLSKNVYNNMKRKILLFPIKAEYNIISNFLFDFNIFKIFFNKEINNNYCKVSFQNKNISNNIYKNINNKNGNFLSLINDNKDKDNELFIVKTIYKKHCLNHSILILRFTKYESFNNNNNENRINKKEEFLDLVISFYTDISDNSTVLINEIYSNLSDLILMKFNKLIKVFYEKLPVFVKEKMNKYYCFESILIQKNITNVFNYLYSCKICHNEKFQIKKIKKIKEGIEISCQIGSIFPVDICESKLFIRSFSNNSCLVEIVNWMNTGDFNTQGKLLNIKSIISLFLKKLRSRIINDEIISTKIVNTTSKGKNVEKNINK